MGEESAEETDFDYIALQHQYGGKFVVRRGNEVIVSADSYDELDRKSETMPIDWDSVVVQYVQRPDEIVINGLRLTLQGDIVRPRRHRSAGSQTLRSR
jgi:hypothetical protein